MKKILWHKDSHLGYINYKGILQNVEHCSNNSREVSHAWSVSRVGSCRVLKLSKIKSYVEIIVENRCEGILTLTRRLLITLTTIKSFPEITGRDCEIRSEVRNRLPNINHSSFSSAISVYKINASDTAYVCSQSHSLSTIYLHSLSIVNDGVRLTWRSTSDSHMIVTLVSQWRTERGISGVWLVLS